MRVRGVGVWKLLSRIIVVAFCVGAQSLLAGTSPALAGGDSNRLECGNEALAGFRTYLPDCRAYEMVSPTFKQGFQVEIIAGSSEKVIGVSLGRFAQAENSPIAPLGHQGATYEFERTESGWSPRSLTPPAAEFAFSSLDSMNTALEEGLWETRASELALPELALRISAGAFTPIGPIYPRGTTAAQAHGTAGLVGAIGASADVSHVIMHLNSGASFRENDPLWPGDTTLSNFRESLYEYRDAGHPGASAEPELVGVRNEGPLEGHPVNSSAKLISQCGTILGGELDKYNAVSADGGTVVFTATAGGCEGESSSGVQAVGTGPLVNELYARIDGSQTVAISEPSLSLPGRECSGACEQNETIEANRKGGIFQGASQDGSKVLFLTSQALVNGDEQGTGTGQDLYEAEVSGGAVRRLAQVSHDPHPGEAAEALGVVRVSEDGSHVYFVAKGVLTEGKNAEGKEPEKGAENLYVYEPDPNTPGSYVTRFVATLLSEAEEAKLNEDAFHRLEERVFVEGESIEHALALYQAELSAIEEAKSVWGTADKRSAETTPDGRFLVFLAAAQLTPDDTSSVGQLFEYDAQSGHIARVSIGQGNSFNQDGNVNNWLDGPHMVYPELYTQFAFAQEAQSRLTMSDDGSRVFFVSRDRLVPQAASGSANVYEYSDGDVHLISDGEDTSTGVGGEASVQLLGTDASGVDVFFTTADQLTSNDTDTQVDVYDARQQGGFAQADAPENCNGDGCHGPLSAPPGLAVPGSATQPAEGNLPSPPAAHRPGHKSKHSRKRRKRKHPTGKHNHRKLAKGAKTSRRIGPVEEKRS